MSEYDGFEEIKKIYDSLPKEQKKLIAPRGKFVNSPFVAERVLSETRMVSLRPMTSETIKDL